MTTNLAARRRPGSAASSPRSATPSAEVAPVAAQQADMFVSLDTTFASLASVARPFIQETISESAADARRRHRDAAADPAVPRSQRRRCSPSSSRGSSRCGPTPPTIASALEVGAPVLADSPGAERAAAADRRRAAPAQRRPRRPRRHRPRSPDRRTSCGRRSTSSRRRRRVCNYPTLALRNVAELPGAGQRRRHLAAVHRLRPARRAEQRGLARRRRRPTAASPPAGRRPQLPALQPLPEHGRPGPEPSSARPATRATSPAQQVIGDRPRPRQTRATSTATQGTVTAGPR